MWLPAFGQKPQQPIDAIRSDKEVQQLVRATDEDYKTFEVSSRLRFADKRVEKQYRQAKIKAWEKADIDGNGYTDLLITGTHHDEDSKVVCLLDMGNGKLLLEPFDRQFYRFCPVAKIVYDGPQPLISYTDFDNPFLVVDSLQDKKAFLLVYRFRGFIEYNKQPAKEGAFDSIVYESDFAYHDVITSKQTVDALGNATYYSCKWPVLDESKKTCESLKTVLDFRTLREISELISYLNIEQLQPTYQTDFNHVPYASLKISFRNGRKIDLYDKGEMGTFGLMRLYALLGQLRKSQSWQPVKP
ncbi:hypothetical protein J0X19_00105 [Hymenobacter sp. BT186]|uniref:Uncharacterized protein n=1 Tax=Hymenobacter telluris TaxID=2816474 RepID=A0A939ETS5_9BACT|nr:hypothetical protein [Hymenobacter telluris]MBO0356332.1 hypothetical protein [Hymenobacter telluris]MBW3372356.1 hypothetical protein [Hymenobacter norwichensis]